jgi:hypothetical protein
MEAINGKTYPMWGQFVDNKDQWIGGTMREFDRQCGPAPSEKITDIKMEPNGTDSAMFVVCGETYQWSCDVQSLSVGGGDNPVGGIRLHTRWGDHCDITRKLLGQPVTTPGCAQTAAVQETSQASVGGA